MPVPKRVRSGAIDGDEGEASWSYRALASHWLGQATPGTNIHEVVNMAMEQAHIDDRTLMNGLRVIGRMERLVPFRGE